MQFSCTTLASVLHGGTFASTFHHKGSSSGQLFNSGETYEATLPIQQSKEKIKNINKKNEKEIKKVSKKTEKVLYETIKYHHVGAVHTPNIAQLIPAIVTTTEPHELLVNIFGVNQRVTAVPGVGDVKSSILHPSESSLFELVAPDAGLTQSVTTIQDFPPTQFYTSIAGLKVERIIDEPTAAAIAYGMDKAGGESNNLVFDLGGSTFDVTLLTIDNGVLEMLATNRDNHLVGENFDQRVIPYFLKVTKKKGSQDTSGDKKALQKLHKEVEGVKHAFSSQQQARLEIKVLAEGFVFLMTLTRVRSEELNNDFSKKTLGPMVKVLYDADVSKSESGEITLVGGSTRIPEVQSLISEYFGGKEPSDGGSVVYGAAVQRGIRLSEHFGGKEPSDGVSVAYGAAVQGGILSGEDGDAANEILLLDVAPLSRVSVTSFQVDKKLVPFVIASDVSKPMVHVSANAWANKCAQEEVSAMILGNMKIVGKDVKNAFTTVHACFKDAQLKAPEETRTIAGLKVERIIDEPIAIAYGTDKAGGESNVLVFDLGGSTFDVTLLTIDNGLLKVPPTNRDNHLVGEDFDQRVIPYILKVTKKKGSQDTSGDKKALQKLHKEVERVSSQQQARLEIKVLAEGFDFSMTLSRLHFEESVAYGAAVQGGIPSGKGGDATSKILLLDGVPFSQGIETVGGAMTQFINRGTTNSAKKSQTFLTLQDNKPAVNIQVYEGERSMIIDNHLLGQFGLTGSLLTLPGVPQRVVSSEVDANSILQVAAEGKGAQETIRQTKWDITEANVNKVGSERAHASRLTTLAKSKAALTDKKKSEAGYVSFARLALNRLPRIFGVVLLVNAAHMGARLIGGAAVSAARLGNFHEGNGRDSNVIGISVAEHGKEPAKFYHSSSQAEEETEAHKEDSRALTSVSWGSPPSPSPPRPTRRPPVTRKPTPCGPDGPQGYGYVPCPAPQNPPPAPHPRPTRRPPVTRKPTPCGLDGPQGYGYVPCPAPQNPPPTPTTAATTPSASTPEEEEPTTAATTPSASTPEEEESGETRCSKFAGDDCTTDTECCYGAKCGTESKCYTECGAGGDYCVNDGDCCESSKCTGGVNPYCYRALKKQFAAAPLASEVVHGKKVRIQLLSISQVELLGLLVFDNAGTNIVDADTNDVSITDHLVTGSAVNAITGNEEGCTLTKIGSFVEVTLASSTDISAVEVYTNSMAENYDIAPADLVLSIQDDAGDSSSYAELKTVAGSRSQTIYAADFRNMCTTSTACIAACANEECKKACGWDMGNGKYDPSLWCAMEYPDKEMLSLVLCELQTTIYANRVEDVVATKARRLSGNQCDSGQAKIEIGIKTDDYPKEISWTLKRQTNNCKEDKYGDYNYEAVHSRPREYYTRSNKLYTETVCSEPSKFKFTIEDKFGGITKARITVKMNDQLVFAEDEISGYRMTKDFGECKTVFQSCITGSKFWEMPPDTIHAINLKQSMGANSLIVQSFGKKRRRARNSAYSGGRETIWSEEQEHWVKKGFASFTFEVCRRTRKDDGDYLSQRCPYGYVKGLFGLTGCWKSCPEWMVQCGDLFCATDTGMCAKKVFDIALAFLDVLLNLVPITKIKAIFNAAKVAFKTANAGLSAADKTKIAVKAMMRKARQEGQALAKDFLEHVLDVYQDVGLDFHKNVLVNLVNVEAGNMMMAGALADCKDNKEGCKLEDDTDTGHGSDFVENKVMWETLADVDPTGVVGLINAFLLDPGCAVFNPVQIPGPNQRQYYAATYGEGQRLGDTHCTYGQKVDWTGRDVFDQMSVDAQPKDYEVTCAKTEAEAIEFEGQDEIQPMTRARMFTRYHTGLCESEGTCRQERASCCSDPQCCYGLTCQSNAGNPGYNEYNLRTCQQDPEYKWREPGETCNIFEGPAMSCNPGLRCEGTGRYHDGSTHDGECVPNDGTVAATVSRPNYPAGNYCEHEFECAGDLDCLPPPHRPWRTDTRCRWSAPTPPPNPPAPTPARGHVCDTENEYGSKRCEEAACCGTPGCDGYDRHGSKRCEDAPHLCCGTDICKEVSGRGWFCAATPPPDPTPPTLPPGCDGYHEVNHSKRCFGNHDCCGTHICKEDYSGWWCKPTSGETA